MKEYISFSKYYKDSITDYHKLSQEEVEELYAKDKEAKEEKLKNSAYNLIKEEKQEQIKAVEEEINALKEDLNNDYLNIFNPDRKKEIKEQIESKKLELEYLKIRANYYEAPKLNYLRIANSLNSMTKKNRRLRTFPSRETRNKIVNGNLDLAFYLASKYYHKEENEKPLDDLVQIANKALISAAAYYVPSDRAKFRTYARKCIENQLKSEVFDSKKKKKSVHKPKTFFEDERAKMNYVKMYLENFKIISRSGKKYYSAEKENSEHLFLYRFREDIREYNKDKKVRCENDKMHPSFSHPNGGYEVMKNFHQITYRISTILKSSKINALITEEDRIISNLYNNYKNVSPSLEIINELIYVIDCYLMKLDLIEEYLKAEKDFTFINEGIVPDEAEMLEQINYNVTKFNNERRTYIKKGLADDKEKYYKQPWDIPKYKRFVNYYNVYKEMYKVDFLLTEYTWNKEEYKSREDEIEEIEDDFAYEIEVHIEYLSNLILDITVSKYEKIYLKQSNDSLSYEWVVNSPENSNSEYFYSKEDAIKLLEERIEILNSMDSEEYVNKVLEERKNNALKKLKEINEPIIENNKMIAQAEDRRAYYKNPKKKRKEHEVKQASEAVQLLYMDDEDLFILMYNQNKKDRYRHTVDIPLEDEVFSNLFLQDYYEALEELPELEKEVLIRYYDKDGRHSKKAKDIASELDITEKKVYVLKDKALSRLRKNKKMQSYLEY